MRYVCRIVVTLVLICLAVPSASQGQEAEDAYRRGIAYIEKGDYDRAIACLDQVIAQNPNSHEAYYARAWAWEKKGDSDRAIADFTEVILLTPTHADSRYNRGVCWQKKREYDRAITDYSRALQLDPKGYRIRNNLAWLQATSPDAKHRNGKQAVENALEACRLYDREDWRLVSTLAAAYAENGEFEKARERQRKAIELVQKDEAAAEQKRKDMEAHLKLFEANKPFRLPSKSP